MHADEFPLQGFDPLREEREAVLVECFLDQRDPSHRIVSCQQDLVTFGPGMDAAASAFLRRIAGDVGSLEDGGRAFPRIVDGNGTDARADPDTAPAVRESKSVHDVAHLLGHLSGPRVRALLEDDPELVATQTGERFARSNALAEQLRDARGTRRRRHVRRHR